MNEGFPKVTRAHFTGNKGVNLVSKVINDDLGWILRENNNETDFGIDAYVDVVHETGSVTGQTISIQIKSGPSFFKHKSPNGFKYYGEIKHFNYYANSPNPIIIIICNIESEVCYWKNFYVQEVEVLEKSWKINIPKSNILGVETKKVWEKLLPPVNDFLRDAKEQTKIDNILKSTGLIHYVIDRALIENEEITLIENFFDRLQRNDDLTRAMQGRVIISVHGYDNDRRELFEIPEVIKWFKKANSELTPWFFFLNTDLPTHSFLLFWEMNVDVKVVCDTPRQTGYQISNLLESGGNWPQLEIQLDPKLFEQFMKQNWIRLNEMTHNLGMSIEENKQISLKIVEILKRLTKQRQ
jgi:hypothetical protein